MVRRQKTSLSQHDTGSAPGSSGQYGNPPSQVKLAHAVSTHLVAWAEVSWTARRALPPRGGRDRSIEWSAAVNTASLGRAGVDAAWHRRSPVIEGRYHECISISRVRGFAEWRPQALPKGSTDRSIDRCSVGYARDDADAMGFDQRPIGSTQRAHRQHGAALNRWTDGVRGWEINRQGRGASIKAPNTRWIDRARAGRERYI